MTCFYCNNDFASMMTCIYVAWASKLGHSNIKLHVGEILQPEFFVDYIFVEADDEKAQSVIRSIRQKISEEAYNWVYFSVSSTEESTLDDVYRFLVLGFYVGRDVCRMLQRPEVMRVMELRRRVSREAYLSREFLRFNCITLGEERFYVANFEPQNDVVFFVAQHFEDRMNIENWIIVDVNRNKAMVHPKNSEFFQQILTEEEKNRLLKAEEGADLFVNLWREYFNSIAIKERENYVCQRTHFPVWMRKHVTEFMDY